MSKYLGDFKKGATIQFKFTTYRPSTGAPYLLAGTPLVRVYKVNNTTEISTGVSLTANFDGVTGLNHVEVVTSDSIYDDPGQYEAVITQGTVDSVSVVGACVGRFTIGLNADAVWDEAYSDHTTSGSFGRLMDILRKANLVTEGVVTSATANNTVMQFVSTTTDIANKADDHWRGQTLLFVSGNLTGQSTTVARFNTSTNTITVDSPLTEAPAINDEFVMMPVHIHPIDEIGEAFLSARLKSIGQLGIVSATTVTSGPDITGVNSYVADDTVTFLGSAPANMTAGTKYYVLSTGLTRTNFQLATSSGGTAITPTTAATYTVIPYDMRTVRAAMQYLRNKVEIVSSTLNVYTEDDTAKAWTAAVATSGSTTPITSSDPA
jgi:hypothetical protein